MITQSANFNIGNVTYEILWQHIMGALIMTSFRTFVSLVTKYFNHKTEDAIYFGFVAITVYMLFIPLFTKKW